LITAIARVCLGLLAVVGASLLGPAPHRATTASVAATVAGTPIPVVAYQRRVRLLHALPLMNDPMRVPVPPSDAAIDQLVAERVIVLEGARRHVIPMAADVMRARTVQRQEYTSVGGLASLERRGLMSFAEARDEVATTALEFALDRRLGTGWFGRAQAADHVVYYVGSQALDTPAPVVGHPAPDVAVQTLAGHPTSIAMLRGHPTILNVWATWCRWCGRELPLIARFGTQHPHLRVVALEEYGSRALVQAWLRAHPAHPAILYDGPGRLSQIYGIDLLPTTIALDAQGRIRAIVRGYLHGEADLERLGRATG